MKHQKHFPVMAILLAMLSPAAADWSSYRGGASRTGYTPEPLPRTLALQSKISDTHVLAGDIQINVDVQGPQERFSQGFAGVWVFDRAMP